MSHFLNRRQKQPKKYSDYIQKPISEDKLAPPGARQKRSKGWSHSRFDKEKRAEEKGNTIKATKLKMNRIYIGPTKKGRKEYESKRSNSKR